MEFCQSEKVGTLATYRGSWADPPQDLHAGVAAIFGSQTLVELHAMYNKRRCTYVH